MTDETTTDGGRPRRVSDDELIHAVRVAIREQAAPVATTSDIEDKIPLSKRGLQKRMRELRERGALGSKQAGRTLVWWVPEKSPGSDDPQPAAVAAAESDEQAVQDPPQDEDD